jgi:CubicO group peptidase (beta-lactamase class C family)
MPIRRLLVPLLLLTAGCQAAPDQAPATDPQQAERIARIENGLLPGLIVEGEPLVTPSLAERMEELQVPGVSVAVIDGGEIVWARGYGLADVASGRPVTPETLFQAASISKPVAAMAALDLVEDGLLDLDDGVNDRLSTWKVPANEFTAASPVTLRGLLTHTAGLTVHGFPGYGPGETVPSTRGVLDGEGNTDPVRVDVKPRTEWSYSGGGYTVMQQLVEDVTGEPFAAVLAKRVLGPLGMSHSTYEQPLPEALHDQAATGYDEDGAPVPGRFHTYPEQAAAGLWTTPSDLARYLMSVQRGKATGEHPVLSGATIEQMLTPDLQNWGLGPAISGDYLRFSHGGSNFGFRCTMTAFIDGDQGVVVMTNSDNGGRLVDQVAMTVAQEYGWPSPAPERKTAVRLAPEALAAIVGLYRGPPGEARLVVRDGVLVSVPSWEDGRERELLAESADRFFARDGGLDVEVFRDEDGAVTALQAAGMRYERIE